MLVKLTNKHHCTLMYVYLKVFKGIFIRILYLYLFAGYKLVELLLDGQISRASVVRPCLEFFDGLN